MERYLFCVLAVLLGGESASAKVTVQLEDQPIAVKTSTFTARIEPDGCLTNLALGGNLSCGLTGGKRGQRRLGNRG